MIETREFKSELEQADAALIEVHRYLDGAILAPTEWAVRRVILVRMVLRRLFIALGGDDGNV